MLDRILSVARQRLSFGREVVVFGVVGLAGFVTDVGVFNVLRSGEGALLGHKPVTAKILAVVVATAVTYAGSRWLTWRDRPRGDVRREIVLFGFFNVVGLLISVACLALSHYVLGLTSPFADNVSANGIGLVLGTLFRFWAYRTHVFPAADADVEQLPAAGPRHRAAA